jgi:hypothetical protein
MFPETTEKLDDRLGVHGFCLLINHGVTDTTQASGSDKGALKVFFGQHQIKPK